MITISTSKIKLNNCNIIFDFNSNKVKYDYVDDKSKIIIGLDTKDFDDILVNRLNNVFEYCLSNNYKDVSVDLSSFNNIFNVYNILVDTIDNFDINANIYIPINNHLNKTYFDLFTNDEFEKESLITDFDRYQNKFKDEMLFRDYLCNLIIKKNYDAVEVYKRAQINKSVFSKIINYKTNPPYKPKKETVAALAIGLKLSLNETIEFYSVAGYSLSKNTFIDKVIRFFVENKIYDMFEINSLLMYYKHPPLGEKCNEVKVR